MNEIKSLTWLDAEGDGRANKTKGRPETVEASQLNLGPNAKSRSVKHLKLRYFGYFTLRRRTYKKAKSESNINLGL